MSLMWQDDNTPHTLAFPKPTRLKSSEYLAWIRQQPCLVCNVAATAHHTVSRGARGSDWRAVPLCWRHHDECHKLGPARFQLKHQVLFMDEVVRLLETFIAGRV